MREDDVFPGAQENVGVGRVESAANRGALGLEEALTRKTKSLLVRMSRSMVMSVRSGRFGSGQRLKALETATSPSSVGMLV